MSMKNSNDTSWDRTSDPTQMKPYRFYSLFAVPLYTVWHKSNLTLQATR